MMLRARRGQQHRRGFGRTTVDSRSRPQPEPKHRARALSAFALSPGDDDGRLINHSGPRFRLSAARQPRLLTEPRGCLSRRRRCRLVVLASRSGRNVAGSNCVSVSTLLSAEQWSDLAVRLRWRKLTDMSQDDLSSFRPHPGRQPAGLARARSKQLSETSEVSQNCSLPSGLRACASLLNQSKLRSRASPPHATQAALLRAPFLDNARLVATAAALADAWRRRHRDQVAPRSLATFLRIQDIRKTAPPRNWLRAVRTMTAYG